MAWLGIFLSFLSDIRKITQFIMSGCIYFPTSYAQEEKNHLSELETNPGPLASKATALTTRPCLLGQQL